MKHVDVVGMGLFLTGAVFALGVNGCARPWRPPALAPAASQPTTAATFDMRPYLEAARLGRWSYVRHEDPRLRSGEVPTYPPQAAAETPPDSEATFTRTVAAEGFREGILLNRRIAPIGQYLRRSQAVSSTQPAERVIQPINIRPRPRIMAFFELDTPLPPIPDTLKPGEPAVNTTPMRYYDERGRFASTATLTRTAEIQGFEAVETPAGKFEDCVRTRVTLEVRFSWLSLDWTSYMWLSRKAGEVRRLSQMSGWFLIFPFNNAVDDLLASRQEPADSQPGLAPAAEWSRGLITFSRGLPRPEISGMLVEYAKP